MAVQSTAMAVQNLLLACRAEGLGCVLTTLLCSRNQYSWPGPESCEAAANASGELYVRVSNGSGTYGAGFDINVTPLPGSQGSSATPTRPCTREDGSSKRRQA